MQSDWIKPNEAVFRLSGVAGGDGAAGDLIAQFLGTGRIGASAEWILEEPDRGDINLSPKFPQIKGRKSLFRLHGARGKRTSIAASFWRWKDAPAQNDWGVIRANKEGCDLQRWDWESGRFVVKAPPLIPLSVPELKVPRDYRISRRYVAFDVRLAHSDVLLALDSLPKQPPKAKTQRVYNFEHALWALLEIAASRGLEAEFGAPRAFGTHAKIQNWIAFQFDPNGSGAGPGETWRKEHATKVVELMEQAKLLKTND